MTANRVLLVHRDPAVQEAAARTLGRIGVTLDMASGTADALARIALGRYDVIVVERDDEVLAAVAATTRAPRPVVIVTTENRDSTGLDAELVSLVVPEPYDANTLIGVILACVTPDVVPPGDSPDGPSLPGR